jgi:hypothetical protein
MESLAHDIERFPQWLISAALMGSVQLWLAGDFNR